MLYSFSTDCDSKMSVREFRNYLLKSNSTAKSTFDVDTKDLYRAKWSIKQFVREYELYIGKKIAGYAYIDALDFWKVFI